jgi:hypothetical protein
MKFKTQAAAVIACVFAGLPGTALATPDLYVKDTPADTGVEPNPDPGPMWLSEDIWVRTSPDPNYRPQPFPEASPTWIPAPHQNPEYRDPRFGLPNYVYVRVRNRGTTRSAGSEQLQLYWAKASTGLSWPTSWVDSLSSVCGANRLLGAEITKPRKNAAAATAAERQALRDAYIQVANNGASGLLAGYNYWTKQQHIHSTSPDHGNPAFLSWHREFLNRFELLLQEADPRVKLMYWNWTTDPMNSGGVNLYTSSFMGNSGRGTGGTGMGAPLVPALNPLDLPAAVIRDLSGSTSPPAESDAVAINGTATQPRDRYFSSTPSRSFSQRLEATPNHNSMHGYVGGAGDMSFPALSTRDPFFFLLHGKVDELWARWQRVDVSRLATATAYDDASGSTTLTRGLRPWDGTFSIDPWTPGGGYIVSKNSFHRSVLAPPIYDTAPLTIPALNPGETVILELPWYPPNPAHYACLGDMNHFCLLGRVTPGITTPEGADVNDNVRNNNQLAWKNITVVDDFAGALAALSLMIRNDLREDGEFRLTVRSARDRFVSLGDSLEAIHVGLPHDLAKRWTARGGRSEGFRPARLDRQRFGALTERMGDAQFVTMPPNEAFLSKLPLKAGEVAAVHLLLQLRRDYQPADGQLYFDVVQTREGANARDVIGGIRYAVDTSALRLVRSEGEWRFASQAPTGWEQPRFDDARWTRGRAPFGFGLRDAAGTGFTATKGREGIRVGYFRKQFNVVDRAIVRSLRLRLRYDDGAVVYLNGRELHRANLPAGPVTASTLALREVVGAAEDAFFPVDIPAELLREGSNVLAVSVHQAKGSNADMVFDAELVGNAARPNELPTARFTSITEGTLVPTTRAAELTLDAVAPSGRVKSVVVSADGKPIASFTQPPYRIKWRPRNGPQTLEAVVTDSNGGTQRVSTTVVGMRNVPPTVDVTKASSAHGGAVELVADARDTDGKIAAVEFFVAQNDRFDSPMVSVGRVTAPPFRLTIKVDPGKHRLVQVQATDNQGAIAVGSMHLGGSH